MRAPRILALYLARELLLYTAIGFLTAFPVVLIPNFAQRMHEFLVPGVTLADVLEVLLWVTPLVAAYALPIAFLFGTLMALGRLTADGEIDAMRGSGLGAGPLALALLGTGALTAAASAWLVIGVGAQAQRQLTLVGLELGSRGGWIESGRFKRFGERMVFARDRGGERLEGIVISDWSDAERPFFVFAEVARIRFDRGDGTLHLLLENGDVHMEPGPGAAFDGYRLSFARLDYAFATSRRPGGGRPYWPDELSPDELRDVIARAEGGDPLEELVYPEARVYRTQLHRLYAIPLAPLLFAVVGIALGVGDRVRGRARGFLLAGVVLVAYYSLFVFGQSAGQSGRLPPAVAIWAPNALLALAALALLRRPAR